MLRSKVLPAALAASLFLGASGAALASEKHDDLSDRQEAGAVLEAKTSLAAAIAVAEQETGGKAMEASLEEEDGRLVYEIRIAKADGLEKVMISPDSGKVLKTAPASFDHEDEEDDDD